jgi:hypothetical protein
MLTLSASAASMFSVPGVSLSMSNSAGSQSVLQPGDPGGDPLSRRVSSASLSRVLRSRRERCAAAVVEMF